MITVAGFNTAVDKYLEVETLPVGGITRASAVRSLPGGKGIHVAVTCAALGEPVALVGLIDPPHRQSFTRFLAERGVDCRWVEVGAIRTCLAIHDGMGNTTEVLEPGPQVEAAAREALASELLESASRSAVTVFSGSLPRGFPQDGYGHLIHSLRTAATRSLLDTSGPALAAGLQAQPFGVKLNRAEASELLGRPLPDPAAAARGARALAKEGVQLAIISLGAEGLVAVWEGRACRVTAPAIGALNAVGAGDCLLAGLAVGLARGLAADAVLRLGAACGAAKVLHPDTGAFRIEDVARLGPEIRIEWLEG